MAHPSLFDFADTTLVWCPRYTGPLHVKGITWTNVYASAVTPSGCIRLYRISNSSVEDCVFSTLTNPGDATSDLMLVSDCMNFRAQRCKWENARYGIICNRTRNIYAKDNEINDCRHFVSPGYGTYGVYVDHAWGRNNTSIIDAHEAINCTFTNITDEGGYAGVDKNDMFNCRALGFTLKNVYWEGYADGAGNKNIYLGMNSTFAAKYVDLLRRFPISIENVSFHTRTAPIVSIIRAGTVVINGFSLGGSATLELGNSTEGIDQISGLETVSGYVGAIRQWDPIQLWPQISRPQHWCNAEYTEYTGNAVSGSGTSVVIEDHTLADDDINGYLIEITSGTGIGQVRVITDYDNGTLTATIGAAWTTPLDGTSVYRISIYNCNATDMRYYGQAYRYNKLRSHLWGGDVLGGELDLRTRRLRVTLGPSQAFAVPGGGTPRYEVMSLKFCLNHSWTGTRPVRQEWKYKVWHYSNGNLEAVYCSHDGLYHATNDWGLTAADWSTPFPGTLDAKVDVSLTLGANIAGHSMFLDADASGYL